VRTLSILSDDPALPAAGVKSPHGLREGRRPVGRIRLSIEPAAVGLLVH